MKFFLMGLFLFVLSANPPWVSASQSHVKIWVEGGYRYVESNGLPNHNVGSFPNPHNPNTLSEQTCRYRVSVHPQRNSRVTRLGFMPFGVAVNGVPFDPSAAEYRNNDPQSGWQYEALSKYMNLGMDQSNGHVQPNGAYHYHGIPLGLVSNQDLSRHSALIGYTVDGFPVYVKNSYRIADDPSSGLVVLKSSYQLKSGVRQGGPGGLPDGRFVNDYEYVAGTGDLDECNGREGVTPEYPQGTYYYVLTDTFPFIPRCLVGLPDSSFLHREAPPPKGRGLFLLST